MPKCQGGRGHCPFKDMSSCHDVKMYCSHVVMYLYSLYTIYICLLNVHSFCKIYNFLFQFFPRICKRVSKTFAISYNLLNSSVLNVHSDHSMFVIETVFIVLFKIYTIEYIYSVSFMAIHNSPVVKDGMNLKISLFIFLDLFTISITLNIIFMYFLESLD